MPNVTVGCLREAVEIASRLRSSGDYDLFRGQKRNWPVVSSLGRLAPPARTEAEERFTRFDAWIQNTPGLEHYRNDLDATVAVAQHYGIPTTYIDFTTSPEVAAFFASDGYSEGDDSVLVCLNSQDLLNIAHSVTGIDEEFDKFLTRLKFQRPATPNLWRMESQKCVFLDAPVIGSIEKSVYNMDRIFIHNPTDRSPIERESIYPTRKSDLERLLDQFFSLERRLPAIENMHRLIDIGAFTASFEMKSPEEYYLRLGVAPDTSWQPTEKEKWMEGGIAAEPFSIAKEAMPILLQDVGSVQTQSDLTTQIMGALGSGRMQRDRPERFTLQASRTLSIEDARFEEARLEALWDGIRRLPYSDGQVATCVARSLCLATLPDGEKELIESPVEVGMGTNDGAYARAVVDRRRLQDAFRPDLRQIVNEAYWPRLDKNPVVALLWIPDPRQLFSFDGFLNLLVYDVLPSQMRRRSWKRAPFFSPWRISTFGLP